VEGILKSNKENVVLVCEVSYTADITDVERAYIIGKVLNRNSIPIVIGKEMTDGAHKKSLGFGVLLL